MQRANLWSVSRWNAFNGWIVNGSNGCSWANNLYNSNLVAPCSN